MAVESHGSFADILPRVYELKAALADAAHPDAYFQNFEESLRENASKLSEFRRLERHLEPVSDTAWATLRLRAAKHLVPKVRHRGRGWQQQFDVLNEARAYGYLQATGCTNIHFIEQRTRKTPDLEALRGARRVLCEVKTINISDDEAEKRRRTYSGEILATKVSPQLDDVFLAVKLRNTLTHAVAQLDAEDPHREADRIVFVVLHFDDFIGDYLPEYLAQIDAYLLEHQIESARLVICVRDYFGRTFRMRFAAVLTD